MIEIKSPLFAEIIAEVRQRSIVLFLEGRFGDVPPEIKRRLSRIRKEQRLDRLVTAAAQCADLAAFQRLLKAR